MVQAMTPKNQDIDTAAPGQPLPDDGRSRCPKHGWVLIAAPPQSPWCSDCIFGDPHPRAPRGSNVNARWLPCQPPAGPGADGKSQSPPAVFHVVLSSEQYEATKEALRFAIGDGVSADSPRFQRVRLDALRAIEGATKEPLPLGDLST